MNGIDELLVSIKAGYSFFYCETEELERTISSLREALIERPVVSWDFETHQDPGRVISILDAEETAIGTVMIALNWNWFLKDEYGNVEKYFCSVLQNRQTTWTTSESRRTLIIVGTDPFGTAIPEPLQRVFLPVKFSMPGESLIKKQLDYIIDSAKGNPKFQTPSKADRNLLVSAAKGMTEQEIQNSFAYSIVKTGGTLDPKLVSKRKAVEVEKTAGLKIGNYLQTLKELKGYDTVRDFVLGTVENPMAKGVMLLGPPGVGKTTFARAIGSEVKKIVFEMEMAELFGGLLGDTERLVRTAVDVIKANAPCILFVDEIEKGLAGVNSQGDTSGGTTKRAMSQFLKFLSDGRPEGIYVIATCNDITSLAPEWIRPGRWDSAPFFLDLPSATVQTEIWNHYTSLYELPKKKGTYSGWSGAEVESCCRIARMLSSSVDEASQFIIPVSVTMSSAIEGLRTWAVGKTIPAATKVPQPKKSKKSRKLEL